MYISNQEYYIYILKYFSLGILLSLEYMNNFSIISIFTIPIIFIIIYSHSCGGGGETVYISIFYVVVSTFSDLVGNLG